MKKAIHAYHEMNRDLLDPVIEGLWQEEKKVKKYEDNSGRLAFQNHFLGERLKTESQEVRDAVDRFREDDIATKLAALEAMENKELLLPGEQDLPVQEKERLKIGRQRYRYVRLRCGSSRTDSLFPR